MTARIEARHIYQALSLVLVGLVVAVTVHQLDVIRHFGFGARLTLAQALSSLTFAFLPLALALSKRGAAWPRALDIVVALILIAILVAAAYFLFDNPSPPMRRATWPNYYTALRSFGCCVALATLWAVNSSLLARVPANAYRAAALFVLIAGAVIQVKIAGIVERDHVVAFLTGYTAWAGLGVLSLLWTEARLEGRERSSPILWLGFATAVFIAAASALLGWNYADNARRADPFWVFLYGFLPTITLALCVLLATRSINATMPGVRQFGRVVGMSFVVLQVCLARWLAYAFLPGGNDETWRFLQFMSSLLPLGLLLMVQFEVFSGEDDSSPAAVSAAPPLPSTVVSR